MKITVCDWRSDKGEPCGERADMPVTFTRDGKRYELDLCSQLHGKALAANAREVESEPRNAGYTTTVLPKAGPKGQTIDSKTKEWALAKGGDLAAAVNQRGRQPKDLKERFLASAEGKVWAKNQAS